MKRLFFYYLRYPHDIRMKYCGCGWGCGCQNSCGYPRMRIRSSDTPLVNISPTLVINTSMKRSSRVLHHVKPKIRISFQKSLKLTKLKCPYPKKRNRPGFVDISPTLVIDTSMEKSPRVLLEHGNPKIWYFLNKFDIEFWLVLKSWYQHSSRSQHAPIWRYQGCIVVPSRVDIFLYLSYFWVCLVETCS